MSVNGSITLGQATKNGGGIPDVSGTPSPVAEGDLWRDTSQVPPRLMTLRKGVPVAIDTEETLTTDAFGNPITIE